MIKKKMRAYVGALGNLYLKEAHAGLRCAERGNIIGVLFCWWGFLISVNYGWLIALFGIREFERLEEHLAEQAKTMPPETVKKNKGFFGNPTIMLSIGVLAAAGYLWRGISENCKD